MKRQVGIDFGTTTTALGYRNYEKETDGQTVLISYGQSSEPYCPTVILQEGDLPDKNGDKVHYQEAFGRDAAKATSAKALLKQNFKMDLISKDPAARREAQRLTEKFFRYLHKQYTEKAITPKGASIGKLTTVVTYPAKFTADARQALKSAAEKAGFQNVVLLDEAKAAMQFVLTNDSGQTKAFFRDRSGQKLKVLLIDMGAGTTDIAVFEYDTADPTKFSLLCAWPKNGGTNFGGREVDELLCRFYRQRLGAERIDQSLAGGNTALAEILLRENVKSFKENTLSPTLNDGAQEQEPPQSLMRVWFKQDEPDVRLDRKVFEGLLSNYLPQLSKLVRDALKEAGNLSGKDVGMVLLTGGHSQWYFVKEQLKALGIPEDIIFSFQDPHLVVARGAAQYTEPKPVLRSDPAPVSTPAGNPGPSTQQACCHVLLQVADPGNNQTAQAWQNVKLSIDPNPIHPPVRLEWNNQQLSKQFRPTTLKREAADTIRVGNGAEAYILSFENTSLAEFWYKKLQKPAASQPPVQTTPSTQKATTFPLRYDPKNPLRPVIATNVCHLLAVKKDGTVLSAGFNRSTKGTTAWKNIVSVAAGTFFSVGLRADGTVVVAGDYTEESFVHSTAGPIRQWRNVVSITAGEHFVAGLHADGTVSVAYISDPFSRSLREAQSWRNIVAISKTDERGQDPDILWGLQKDGTCVNTRGFRRVYANAVSVKGCESKNPVILTGAGKVSCDMFGCEQDWNTIIAVDSKFMHIAAVKSDGTAVAAGPNNWNHELNVSGWRNIIAVAVGSYWTLGLTADGRLEIAYKKALLTQKLPLEEIRSWRLF